MKAFILDRYAKGSSLRFGEMPEPVVRDNDVLVQVHAAGVNVLDSKIKNGEFKLLLPYRLPLIMGNDVAGIVVRVGSRVRRFTVGDDLCAAGCWTDRRIRRTYRDNEDAVAHKPKALSMEEKLSARSPPHFARTSRTSAHPTPTPHASRIHEAIPSRRGFAEWRTRIDTVETEPVLVRGTVPSRSG